GHPRHGPEGEGLPRRAAREGDARGPARHRPPVATDPRRGTLRSKEAPTTESQRAQRLHREKTRKTTKDESKKSRTQRSRRTQREERERETELRMRVTERVPGSLHPRVCSVFLGVLVRSQCPRSERVALLSLLCSLLSFLCVVSVFSVTLWLIR